MQMLSKGGGKQKEFFDKKRPLKRIMIYIDPFQRSNQFIKIDYLLFFRKSGMLICISLLAVGRKEGV